MDIPTQINNLFNTILYMDYDLEDLKQVLASDIMFDPTKLFQLIDINQ